MSWGGIPPTYRTLELDLQLLQEKHNTKPELRKTFPKEPVRKH